MLNEHNFDVLPGQQWRSPSNGRPYKGIKSVHAGKHKGCQMTGKPEPHVHYDDGEFDCLFHFGGFYDPPIGLVKMYDNKEEPGTVKESLGERAAQWLEGIATMLREKNKAYGNSLGDPVRIFTDIDPIKLTLARAEDKLSRIARGQAGGEDVPKDLVGYIALAVALGWNGEKLR